MVHAEITNWGLGHMMNLGIILMKNQLNKQTKTLLVFFVLSLFMNV